MAVSILLLQAGVASGLVNAAIVVLVIIFLTLPLVFILADYLRNRRGRLDGSVSAASSATVSVDARGEPVVHYVPPYMVGVPVNGPQAPVAPAVAPAPQVQGPASFGAMDGLGITRVVPGHVAHDFTREAVPPEIGYLPPARRVERAIAYAGHLQVGPGCTVVGDIDVTGSLALGDGTYAGHDVSATGNVYVGRGVHVVGTVRAGGRVFLVAWSRVGAVHSEGPVELEDGAQVSETIEAPDVEHVDRVHDPLVRARQGVQVAVVPTA